MKEEASEKSPTLRFLDEVWAGSVQHPFMRGERLFGMVGVEVSPSVDDRHAGVHLSTIVSYDDGGQGNASKTLKYLLELADKHGVTLDLTAKPYGTFEHAKSTDDLVRWYARNGFVPEEGWEECEDWREEGVFMERAPNAPAYEIEIPQPSSRRSRYR